VRALGFVGTPCQVQGLRKLQALGRLLGRRLVERVELVVGLFCMGNWSYPCMAGFLEARGVAPEEVARMRISGDRVRVSARGMELEFPLGEMRKYVKMACRMCLDFTSELADISAGSTGSPEGWTTLIVRTPRGEEVLHGAEEAGLLELMEVGEAGVEELQRVARAKFERSLRRIQSRVEQGDEVPHHATRDLGSLEEALSRTEGRGFRELWRDIVVSGLCDACGACSAACSELEMRNGMPRLRGRCPQDCSLCYAACTRTALPLRALEEQLELGELRREHLGRYRRILAARATRGGGQDGGAVTALLKFSLNSGVVDEVVLTCRDEELKPRVLTAKREEELEGCAGTVYAASSPLPELRHRVRLST